MIRDYVPRGYAWAAVLLSSISLPALALAVALQVNARSVERERQARLASERAMCAIVITQDDVYRSRPPATETGQRMAQGMHALRQVYQCDVERR